MHYLSSSSTSRRFLSLLPLGVVCLWLHNGAATQGRAAAPRPETAQDPAPRRQAEPPAPQDIVTVTATRTPQRQSESLLATTVIVPADINSSGARTLADLLELEAGVLLERRETGAGIRLSGLPAEYTLLLIEGVRATGRVDGTLDLTRFPLEEVERVEIVRGAASALYGSDAIGGVVNIVTKRSLKRLDTSARASLGNNQTLDVSATLGGAWRRGSTRWTAGHHRTAGFDLDPSDVATTVGSSEQYNVSSTNVWQPRDNVDIQLTTGYLFRDRRAVDLGSGGGVFDRTNRTETLRLQLSPSVNLDTEGSLRTWTSAELFRDQFRQDQRGSTQLDSLQDTRDLLTQIGAQFDWNSGSHNPSVGAEATREHLKTPRLSTGQTTRYRAGAYLQDEWAVVRASQWGRLALLPGARFDADSQFGGAFTPRLALRYDPSPQWTVRTSYGLGFKAPDFRELYLFFQNPSANYLVEGSDTLQPERSRNANASLQLRANRRLNLQAELFHHRLNDRIATRLSAPDTVGPQRFVYANVNAATSTGLELSAQTRPHRYLAVDASYAYTRARDESTSLPLSGQPTQRATLSLLYSARNLGLSARCRAAWVGSIPTLRGEGADTIVEQGPAYTQVDVRVAQELFAGLSAFVLAQNLTNAQPQFSAITPRGWSGGIGFSP